MTIDVRQLSINKGGGAGGIGGSSLFTDNFNRGSLGSNWIDIPYYRLPQTNPYGGAESPGIDGANHFRIQSLGAINNPAATWIMSSQALPCRIATAGKTQFVQATYVNHVNPGGANNPGLIAMIDNTDVSTLSAYSLGIASGTLQYGSQRFNGNSLVALGPALNFVLGDVLRMSVDVDTPGQVTIRLSKNGTLTDTFVDNTGSRLTTGFTGGFWGVLATSGGVVAQAIWDDFSCGLGL